MSDSMPRPKLSDHARHVLVCNGPRCASEADSEAIYDALKAKCKAAGLDQGPQRVKRTRSHCFAACKGGPLMVVWPDGIWYDNVTEAVLDEIVERHLKNGEPVGERVFHSLSRG